MGKTTNTEPNKIKTPSGKDVAKLAGVSRTQVSYVLNGTGTAHVSPERRERILEAARRLGYRPDLSAQSLRMGFSREFSLFFPAPYPPNINSILGSIHEQGLAGNCVVAQYSWNEYRDKSRMRDALEDMLARKPMGVFCSLLDLSREDIEAVRARGVERLLVLDVEPHEDLFTFNLPVERIGYIAARHLLDCGYRNILVLKPVDRIQSRPYALRLEGMRRALEDAPGAELTELEWPRDSIRPTLEAARVFTASLPRGTDRPSALYAFSDDYALPMLKALAEAGYRVPRDIAVLGTDDLPYGEMVTPTLSTIRFDRTDLGQRAVAMINSLITGEPLEDRIRQPPVPLLVPRESTRPLA